MAYNVENLNESRHHNGDNAHPETESSLLLRYSIFPNIGVHYCDFALLILIPNGARRAFVVLWHNESYDHPGRLSWLTILLNSGSYTYTRATLDWQAREAR